MYKYLKSPWIISLLISLLTIAWVKWELSKLTTGVSEEAEPVASKTTEDRAEEAPEMPQTQPLEPVAWQSGMPPPMRVPAGQAFTRVSEVEQDGDDGAFEHEE